LTLDQTVTGFKHEERVSRRQAAERLMDIAFSLTAGETLELRAGCERLRDRVADEVRLTRQGKTTGDPVSVELELSSLT
jgi:amphi-Trp domain-containing protein